MSKKRTRQMRRQMRQIKPKAAVAASSDKQQKRQRERYVASGGLLQGYAPDLVLRIGWFSLGAAVLCLLVMAALIAFLPYGLPVRIAAGLPWLVPIVFLASFVAPAFRLAWKDRKAEPRVVQGNLLGASNASTSLGLGMLMLQTRGGMEQYLVKPERLSKVPGNQVSVMLTVTPNLRHVRSVAVMGQRMVARPEPPVPEVMRRLRILPIATPAALAAAALVGDESVALSPIPNDGLHAALAVVAGTALAAAVYGVSLLLQRRLMAQVQALMPKT